MRKLIETKRLILRPFIKTDWKSLVNYAGNHEVARATGRLPNPYSYSDAINWIGLTGASDKDHIYGIADKGNHLIGCVSLISQGKIWELGYWLGQPHWHQGYMREACAALLAEAKINLSPTKLCACVFTDNPRSLALLQHLGFALCGQSTEFCVARGHDVKAHNLTLSLERDHA